MITGVFLPEGLNEELRYGILVVVPRLVILGQYMRVAGKVGPLRTVHHSSCVGTVGCRPRPPYSTVLYRYGVYIQYSN
jgi:hypothetical protein